MMYRVKRVYIFFVLSVFILSCVSCHSPAVTKKNMLPIQKAREYALSQLKESLDEIPPGRFPIRTDGSGRWELPPPSTWTSGFFPGCLWLAYRLTNDPFWIEHAEKYTETLADQQYNTDHHDTGFMIMSSYGNGYRLTYNPEYKPVILQAARSLATRYNETVGCIQSWNGSFQVIIDNMMNLEILFWAAKHGGGSRLYDIAVHHANNTMKNHLREDGSSFHVVVYDPVTGNVKEKRTVQGFAAHSTWARGQAWGIYGFTMCYRETHDIAYLNTARKMADYFVSHLPPDYIPFWDFNLPAGHPGKYRDASAAAIALSGLLELRNYAENRKQYDEAIHNIFNALTGNYLSEGTESSGILLHCAYNANTENPFDRDSSTIWGDYYFLEAICRYQDLR